MHARKTCLSCSILSDEEKKKWLCTLTKRFSLFHMEMNSTTATHNEPDSRVSFVPQTPLAANLVQ